MRDQFVLGAEPSPPTAVASVAKFGFDDPVQKSLEVRFTSPQDLRFKYQAGVYALDANVDGVGNSETAAARSWSANFYTAKTTSYAPFAQLTYGLTATFRLTSHV